MCVFRLTYCIRHKRPNNFHYPTLCVVYTLEFLYYPTKIVSFTPNLLITLPKLSDNTWNSYYIRHCTSYCRYYQSVGFMEIVLNWSIFKVLIYKSLQFTFFAFLSSLEFCRTQGIIKSLVSFQCQKIKSDFSPQIL